MTPKHVSHGASLSIACKFGRHGKYVKQLKLGEDESWQHAWLLNDTYQVVAKAGIHISWVKPLML